MKGSCPIEKAKLANLFNSHYINGAEKTSGIHSFIYGNPDKKMKIILL